MPGGSLLTIEWVTKWGAGFKIIYLAKGTASLRLAPGNYTIRLEEKKNWPQLYKEKTVKLQVKPGGSYTVEFQSYPHSLQYYTLITIIIIAVYLSTLHPHTIIGSVTAQPVIQGKPATITIEVRKLGLIPKTHNIKIIINNKEINIGTIRLTKPRKYKIKITVQNENSHLEII